MSTQVWKYQFVSMNEEFDIPVDSIILSVQYQGPTLTMWAQVDPTLGREKRRFEVVGTGWEVPEEWIDYHGTVQDPFGLVWHVFEVA